MNGTLILGQCLLGLSNGSIYALLGLSLSLVFGLTRLVNFAQGAQFMLGALLMCMLLERFQLPFLPALILVPLVMGAASWILYKTLVSRLEQRDPILSLLLTMGVAMVAEALVFRSVGASGLSVDLPDWLGGVVSWGDLVMPRYRLVVCGVALALCGAVYWGVEKTFVGARIRASAERKLLARAFGLDVDRLMSGVFALGGALAGLTGALIAPIQQVRPAMGSETIIVVFAVVVVGGMGSLAGSIVAGLLMGAIEGLMRVLWPEASTLSLFLFMALVLVVRPLGLMGSSFHERDEGAL
jgi:branched-chain amino acid transport system permease protein